MSGVERLRHSFLPWVIAGVIAWAGVAWIGWTLWNQDPPRAGFDLALLLDGARAVAAGQSPYDPAMLAGGSPSATELFYSYPPPVAQAMQLVAWLPDGVVLVLWAIGATLGLGHIAGEIARRDRQGEPRSTRHRRQGDPGRAAVPAVRRRRAVRQPRRVVPAALRRAAARCVLDQRALDVARCRGRRRRRDHREASPNRARAVGARPGLRGPRWAMAAGSRGNGRDRRRDPRCERRVRRDPAVDRLCRGHPRRRRRRSSSTRATSGRSLCSVRRPVLMPRRFGPRRSIVSLSAVVVTVAAAWRVGDPVASLASRSPRRSSCCR